MINMKDLISIIVPIYNVEKYLRQCVDSIINQTYQNLEIILIDDGSTDNSGKIADEYAIIDNRIKVFHKKNGGLSDARNFGIDKAHGKYIGFVDSDDFIKKDMYQYLYSNLKKSDSDISICGYEKVYDNNYMEENNCVIKSDNIKVYSFIEAEKLILEDKEIQSFAWNKLYKIELFDNIKYPVGKVMEDVATTYKLFWNSKNIVVGMSKEYFYRQRTESILHNKKIDFYIEYYNIIKERYDFFKNHNIELIYNDIYLMKFIFNLLLLKNAKIDEFIYENQIERMLNRLIDMTDKKLIKDKNLRLRILLWKKNKRMFYCFFGGYYKWIKRIDIKDLL